MELPSRTGLFTRGRDTILSLSRSVSRAVIERRHSDLNMLLNTAATMGDEVIGSLARLQALVYMDTCYASDLDRRVYDAFTLTRKPASPGFTYVRFGFPTPSYTMTIPQGTLLRSTTGIQYTTNEEGLYVGGESQSGLIAARSLFAGADQQVSAGTITSIVTPITGAPSDITVTNPLASAGAGDQETDPEFRSRARVYFLSIGRGTKFAIEAAALAYPGVRKATLVEFADEEGNPGRYNQLVLADKFTEGLVVGNTEPSSYQAQADVFARNVLASLSNTRCSAVPFGVIMAAVRLVPVRAQYPLTAAFASSEAQVKGRVRGALMGYTNALNIGQSLEYTDLLTTLQSVRGVYAPGATLLTPTTRVVARSVELIRTTSALVGLS